MISNVYLLPAADEGPALATAAANFRELPVMPRIVTEVLRQLASPEWTIPAIESTIAADPGLVARMISVSNSAMYGATQEIRSLNQALVRLGFRAIRSLVIVAGARALFPLEDERIGRLGRELWSHSAATGVAARMVAEAVGLRDPDDAFAAGVLHDIGKVVILLNAPDDYERILELSRGGRPDNRAAELATVGIDHVRLASRLASHLTLPAGIVGAITGHHDPDRAGDHARLARVVGCGDLAARLHAGGDRPVLKQQLYEDLGRLGLAFAEAEALAWAIGDELADLGGLV